MKKRLITIVLLIVLLTSMVMAIDVPAGAVTGTALFGPQAACPDCKYWKDASGTFHVVNNAGTEIILTDAQKRALTTKGDAVPTISATPPVASAPPTAAPPAATHRSENNILNDVRIGSISYDQGSEELETMAIAAAPKGSTMHVDGKVYTKKSDGWYDDTGSKLNDMKATGKDATSLTISDGTISRPTATDLNAASVSSTVTVGDRTYKKEGTNWVTGESGKPEYESLTENQLAAKVPEELKDLEEAKKAKIAQNLDDTSDSLFAQSTWWDNLRAKSPVYGSVQEVLSSITSIGVGIQRLGEYRALSTALASKSDVFDPWYDASDDYLWNQWWADGPAALTRQLCEIDDKLSAESPGQASGAYRTPSGLDVSAGAIFAEISPATSPILCERNPDEEAEEEFICSDGLTCKDNSFCYDSEDADVPTEGYFYKISYGVAAPADIKSTPYVDEDGMAVKYNVALYDEKDASGNYVWLYESDTAIGTSVNELRNGDSYTETLNLFLPAPAFGSVCIAFDERYRIKDFQGEEVPNICANFVNSTGGEVEFSKSDRKASSVTPATGEVRRNRNLRRR